MKSRIIFIGLSLSSSWGNGHATTFRALLRALAARGHELLFLERDVPWYAQNRDLPSPDFCRLGLYRNLEELKERWAEDVRNASAVVVGSYVPEGVSVAEWALKEARGTIAFYDIDTPVTLAKLGRQDYEYLSPHLIPDFDLYLSFSGGRALDILSDTYRARKPVAFYCSVDPEHYYPEDCEQKWDLGYLGTYSKDRQPPLNSLMLDAARRREDLSFVVAGPQYPEDIQWPRNVERIEHLPPALHRKFYNGQRWTLNITRADMVQLGHSPSVRLFEAAACGVPIVSDYWDGIHEIFPEGEAIAISNGPEATLSSLNGISEKDRRQIGKQAREIVLKEHTNAHRALQLEQLLLAQPVNA